MVDESFSLYWQLLEEALPWDIKVGNWGQFVQGGIGNGIGTCETMNELGNEYYGRTLKRQQHGKHADRVLAQTAPRNTPLDPLL